MKAFTWMETDSKDQTSDFTLRITLDDKMLNYTHTTELIEMAASVAQVHFNQMIRQRIEEIKEANST